MRGVARLTDRTLGDCSKHGSGIGGTIVSASGDVITNNLGTARLADDVVADCGCTALIITCSGTNTADSRGIARLSDTVQGPNYVGKIVTCSENSFVD